MDKLVTISGPRGAGKGTILNRIVHSPFGRNLTRVLSFTTRAPREGEINGREYFFVTVEKYLEMRPEEILYSTQIGTGAGSYTHGMARTEFDCHYEGITDIAIGGARVLSRHARMSLRLFIFASREERVRRVMARQRLTEASALALIANEPSPAESLDEAHCLYPDFMVINNPDGTEPDLSSVARFLEVAGP